MLKLQSSEIEDYLRTKVSRIRRRGQKAEIEFCPFCNGGENQDKWKCVVYLDSTGGNFKCMRGTCNQSGSFWQLAEHFGDDPKAFYSQNGNGNGHKRADIVPALRPTHFTFKSEPVEPSKLTPEALEYLKKRGFEEEVLDEAAIWCDETGLINFGYYHKSELCMVKVRQPRKPEKSEKKAWQKWKEGLRTLWGIEQCDKELPYIVITFGEYDRIALMQARIQNTVSVPCGDQDLEWINVCWDDLEKFKEIYLWIDGDESGEKALPRIVERLGKEKVKVIRTAFKDANEMLLLRSKEIGIEEAEKEVWNAVATAEWLHHGHLIQLADVEESEQCFDGYTSGIKSIDKALGGFFFKQLIVHAGDTKHGKSAGVNQITAMAVEQGGKVCVWPGEDNTEDYKYKLYVHIAGFSNVDVKTSQRTGTDYASLKPGIRDRIDNFVRDNIIILDARTGMNEDILIDNFKLAFQRFGCDTFVVDNLMKIVAGKETDNTNFRQARICNALSDFAKEYRVTVHLVTHTNKTGIDTEPPTKKSVSGAKEIINLADRVISWWRLPDSVREANNGFETMISILAERVFGNETTALVRYDKTVKRYGETVDEICREYSI